MRANARRGLLHAHSVVGCLHEQVDGRPEIERHLLDIACFECAYFHHLGEHGFVVAQLPGDEKLVVHLGSALVAGLCVNAGVGLLVLFRTNRDFNENLKIMALMLVVGFVIGCGVEALHLL